MHPWNECICVERVGDWCNSNAPNGVYVCSREIGHAGLHRACNGTFQNDHDHMICADWSSEAHEEPVNPVAPFCICRPPNSTFDRCGETSHTSPDRTCSRRMHHSGDHRACRRINSSSPEDHNLYNWPNTSGSNENPGTICYFCFDTKEETRCDSVNEDIRCSRLASHDGNHIACLDGDHEIDEWEENMESTVARDGTRKRTSQAEKEALAAINVCYSPYSHPKKIPASLIPVGQKLGKLFGVPNVQFVNTEYNSPQYSQTGVSNQPNTMLNVFTRYNYYYGSDKIFTEEARIVLPTAIYDIWDIFEGDRVIASIFKTKTVTRDFAGCWNIIFNISPKTISWMKKIIVSTFPAIEDCLKNPDEYKNKSAKRFREALLAKTPDYLKNAFQTEFKRRSLTETTNVIAYKNSIARLAKDLSNTEKALKDQEKLLKEFEENFSESKLMSEIKPILKMTDGVTFDSANHRMTVNFDNMEMTGEFGGIIHKYRLGDIKVVIPMSTSPGTMGNITVNGGVRSPAHPHMLAAGMCWGEHQQEVINMRSQMRWAELIAFIKTFLQQPNTRETYGMTAQRWPEIVDGEYPIKLPPRECCAWDSANYCNNRHPEGFKCTRPKKHEGDHIACSEDSHNMRKWPKVSATATTTATTATCDCVEVEDWCNNENPDLSGYVCSRAEGHAGIHRACAGGSIANRLSHNLRTWLNNDSDVPF